MGCASSKSTTSDVDVEPTQEMKRNLSELIFAKQLDFVHGSRQAAVSPTSASRLAVVSLMPGSPRKVVSPQTVPLSSAPATPSSRAAAYSSNNTSSNTSEDNTKVRASTFLAIPVSMALHRRESEGYVTEEPLQQRFAIAVHEPSEDSSDDDDNEGEAAFGRRRIETTLVRPSSSYRIRRGALLLGEAGLARVYDWLAAVQDCGKCAENDASADEHPCCVPLPEGM